MKRIILLLVALILVNMVLADSTWLIQNNPFNIGDHTIMIMDVDSSATKCGVMVDGQIKWLDKNHGDHFGEVYIFVLDVIAVNTKDLDGDTCQLLISGVKIDEEDEEQDVVKENKTEPVVNLTLYEEETEQENITEPIIIQEPVEEKSILARIISFIISLFK